MLRTRLWVGSLLALAAGGALVGDAAFAPTYPFLFVSIMAVGVLATRELILLLPGDTRPRGDVTTFGVLLVVAANWLPVLNLGPKVIPHQPFSPWEPVLFAFLFVVVAAFLLEMGNYRGPDGCVARVANATFVTGYLGLLGSCLVRIRFDMTENVSDLALAAAIFVPKCGDIGAYLTGRLIGRHRFTPLLSPKKTWEGFAGGMLFAVGVAVAVHYLGPVFRHGAWYAVAFGLLVGLAGVLGDLAESMIKREQQAKDASQNIPGFGGILDVIDSVLFAAPVAYLLLRLQ
jgi:phosphatidate cytidylyltransferase